jgi:hypothetical protein
LNGEKKTCFILHPYKWSCGTLLATPQLVQLAVNSELLNEFGNSVLPVDSYVNRKTNTELYIMVIGREQTSYFHVVS